jgi:hypothetical protein
MAERAEARRVARGVLEIHLRDGRWAEATAELIPRLVRRLATSCPELGIRSYRVIVDGEAVPRPPVALGPAGAVDDPPR